MDIIRTFVLDNTSHTITIVHSDGKPLFRASDIGNVLGIKNMRCATSTFGEKYKGVVPTDTPGGKQDVIFLTESGVYKLLFKSRKSIAEVFQEWVVTVLQSIRETGEYNANKQIEELQKERQIHLQQVEQFEKERMILQLAKSNLALDKHTSLINTFDKQSVVYFAYLRDHEDKKLVKIGSTDDIRQRYGGLKKDFGNCLFVEVYQCNLNANFEKFLHAHELIKRHKFIEVIHKAKKSSEVFLLSDDHLQQCINTAQRNVKTYRTITTEAAVASLEKKMDQRLKKIMEKMGVTDDDEEESLESEECNLTGKRNAEEDAPDEPVAKRPSRRGVCSRGKVGLKYQQYSADGSTLLKTWSQIIDIVREGGLDRPCETSIRSAAHCAKTYRGFRWAVMSRDLPDDTVQELPECMDEVSLKLGWIAELESDQSRVTNVQATCKQMAHSLGKLDQSRLSKALKNGTVYGDKVYHMWADVQQDLREEYVNSGGQLPAEEEPKYNAKKVKQIDPMTKETLKVWRCRDHVLKEFHISAKQLRKALAGGNVLKGFTWQNV